MNCYLCDLKVTQVTRRKRIRRRDRRRLPNDHLTGGGGDDTLIGGEGNDKLKGRGGNDPAKMLSSEVRDQ